MNKRILLASFLISFALLCVAATDITIKIFHQYANNPNPNGSTDILLFEQDSSGSYNNITFSQLRSWLALGAPPSITTFVNNHPSVEIGSTVNSTVLTWTLGGSAPTSQSVNQGIGPIAVGTLTATDLASYTTTRTYTLTVGNSSGSATANTSVTFLNKRYWGPSANVSLTDPQIIALSSEFASTFVGFDHNVTCANEYIYFAFPVSFGVPQVYVDGFHNTAWTITTGPFVNASGASVNYYVYRSNNIQTGGPFRIQLVP